VLFSKIRTIILDADDTLWINNIYFVEATKSFLELFTRNGFDKETIQASFLETEKQLVRERGYGSDNFVLILNRVFNHYQQDARLEENDLNKIIKIFNKRRTVPPKLFPDVSDTLRELASQYDLYLLTKGQQDEQSQKIERSGLKRFFRKCFILPEKDDSVYGHLLQENNFAPEQTCMVGNSPKSDINPALRNGLTAVYIPYEHTWHMDDEAVTVPDGRMKQIETFSQLLTIFSGEKNDL